MGFAGLLPRADEWLTVAARLPPPRALGPIGPQVGRWGPPRPRVTPDPLPERPAETPRVIASSTSHPVSGAEYPDHDPRRSVLEDLFLSHFTGPRQRFVTGFYEVHHN
jgi:hypothetical protein